MSKSRYYLLTVSLLCVLMLLEGMAPALAAHVAVQPAPASQTAVQPAAPDHIDGNGPRRRRGKRGKYHRKPIRKPARTPYGKRKVNMRQGSYKRLKYRKPVNDHAVKFTPFLLMSISFFVVGGVFLIAALISSSFFVFLLLGIGALFIVAAVVMMLVHRAPPRGK